MPAGAAADEEPDASSGAAGGAAESGAATAVAGPCRALGVPASDAAALGAARAGEEPFSWGEETLARLRGRTSSTLHKPGRVELSGTWCGMEGVGFVQRRCAHLPSPSRMVMGFRVKGQPFGAKVAATQQTRQVDGPFVSPTNSAEDMAPLVLQSPFAQSL